MEECGIFYRAFRIQGIVLQLLVVGVCFPKAGPLLGYARKFLIERLKVFDRRFFAVEGLVGSVVLVARYEVTRF